MAINRWMDKKTHLLYILCAYIQRNIQFSRSVVSDSATSWIAAHQASLSIPILEFTQTHAHPIDDAIQPSQPLSSPSPPAPNRSQHQGLSQWVNSFRMRWPKYWSFSFSISPSNEYLGLISFRMEWLDLPAVQETLKSVLQHHSSKASILQHSAFLTVQLSYP